MIPLLLIETILIAARESGKDNDQLIIELNEFTFKVIAWVVGILVFCLLVWVFTDPQFCFRRQFIELWQTIINLC